MRTFDAAPVTAEPNANPAWIGLRWELIEMGVDCYGSGFIWEWIEID